MHRKNSCDAHTKIHCKPDDIKGPLLKNMLRWNAEHAQEDLASDLLCYRVVLREDFNFGDASASGEFRVIIVIWQLHLVNE